jgi:hypothetical protein
VKLTYCVALNILNERTVLEARSEIQTGKHVSLDLPLDHFTYFVAERKAPQQEIIDFKKRGGKYSKYAFDDELHINTQSTSQWDGLRHMALQKDGGLYYNGVRHEDISSKKHGKNGIIVSLFFGLSAHSVATGVARNLRWPYQNQSLTVVRSS